MVPLRAENLISRLKDLGIAAPAQIEQAKQDLAKSQERFSAILVRQGLLRDADLGKRLASQLGVVAQVLNISQSDAPRASRLPSSLWRSQRLVPLMEKDDTLILASDDPFSVFAVDFLRQRCGCQLEVVLIREQEFEPLIEAYTAKVAQVQVDSSAGSSSKLSVEPSHEIIASAPQQKTSQTRTVPGKASPVEKKSKIVDMPRDVANQAVESISSAAADEPIIRLVDSIISEAVRMRASDVHIEPGRDTLKVRYRIDGILHDVNSPPRALHGPVISRIKIISSLNIAEKRLPQDGRLQMSVEGRPLDVRISILPASHGESVVMRLLDRSQPIRGFVEMGMSLDDRKAWDVLIHRPHGMVLVTGPTGSGKTTTLYSSLSMLNEPDRKLITVEDPVEYQLAGVNQVLVKPMVGLTFAAGLRAMLRQAPDVIMVGEIRDRETAQIAVQAALTGHLVLSTLHTNDAPSAITRLIDMGIAPFLIASTVQGVLAQRLVRRICQNCRITDNATAEERAFLGTHPELSQIIRSNGCEKCHNSSFYGRVGLFELLTISDSIRQLIVTKSGATTIRLAAIREGMRTLREDGCAKIREGLTTMGEVLRVIAEES